jgi:iron complex outermembrane receptor protein
MPADRVSLGIKYTTNISKTLQDCYISLGGRYVFEQKRIPYDFNSIDYPRPPAAYLLADAEIGATLQLRKQPLYVSLGVTNLFNTRYRDYLDAFRYFIDQPGRNVVLRVRLPFNF